MSVRLIDSRHLFREEKLQDYLDRQQERLRETIRDISRDRVLQVPISTLADEVHEEYWIDFPTLPGDQQLQERVRVSGATDTEIDVSGDR